MMNLLYSFMLANGGGLGSIANTLIQNWIGPIFIVGVAAFALYFIKERKFRELAAFVLVAGIVGVLIFLGKNWFSKDGALTQPIDTMGKSVKDGGGMDSINAVLILDEIPSQQSLEW